MMSQDEMKEEAKQKIKKLVERFRYNLDVYKKSTYNETQVRIERDKEIYERQIKIVDGQINGLVYDLYGLTEEEIKVVEVLCQ